jgi:aconitase A
LPEFFVTFVAIVGLEGDGFTMEPKAQVTGVKGVGKADFNSYGARQGDETVDVVLNEPVTPQDDAKLVITKADGSSRDVTVKLRIDTPIEVDYYRHGGILPFVLRQLLAA